MRQKNSKYLSHRSHSGWSLYRWIFIVFIIFGCYFIYSTFFSDGSSSVDVSGFSVSGSGSIVITNSEGKKRDITGSGFFRTSDSLFSVISGLASIQGNGMHIWLDKGSDMTQSNAVNSGTILELTKGRGWIESNGDYRIKLRHVSFEGSKGGIVLIEQQNIHSIIYALRGSISIIAGDKSIQLSEGNRFMISRSDLANPALDLTRLSGKIEDSIMQNSFFLARGGEEILRQLSTGSGYIKDPIGDPTQISEGKEGTLYNNASRTITIVNPQDGAIIAGDRIQINGSIQSSQVKKIQINGRDAIIDSKTNTFTVDNIPFLSDSIDIVYKSFGDGMNLLEKGVITLYSSEKKRGNDTLVPTTFPAGDKLFRITSPGENPFKTSSSSITVSGTVPKNTVEYITVNNYRLKKFIPNSTSWYYFANTAYATMKEGFNLYEIKFYGAENVLLSTQLFTIIKEGDQQALSGE